MKKAFAICAFLCALFVQSVFSQTQNGKPFKGSFYNRENRINLVIDLYDETISIPNLSFLGKTNGYMNGNINGTWMLVSKKIEGKTATIRVSNDQGADSQTIKLTLNADSTLNYETVNGNCIRKVVNRKFAKVPSEMVFERAAN